MSLCRFPSPLTFPTNRVPGRIRISIASVRCVDRLSFAFVAYYCCIARAWGIGLAHTGAKIMSSTDARGIMRGRASILLTCSTRRPSREKEADLHLLSGRGSCPEQRGKQLQGPLFAVVVETSGKFKVASPLLRGTCYFHGEVLRRTHSKELRVVEAR